MEKLKTLDQTRQLKRFEKLLAPYMNLETQFEVYQSCVVVVSFRADGDYHELCFVSDLAEYCNGDTVATVLMLEGILYFAYRVFDESGHDCKKSVIWNQA